MPGDFAEGGGLVCIAGRVCIDPSEALMVYWRKRGEVAIESESLDA